MPKNAKNKGQQASIPEPGFRELYKQRVKPTAFLLADLTFILTGIVGMILIRLALMAFLNLGASPTPIELLETFDVYATILLVVMLIGDTIFKLFVFFFLSGNKHE